MWLYYPYVQADGISILFGEGGSMKSYLASWIGLRMALGIYGAAGQPMPPVPVLYLDWEATEDRQRMRTWAVMRGIDAGAMDDVALAEVPFFWRRMIGSLGDNMRWVEDELDKHSIGMVIIDSLGQASAPLGAIEESATTNKHHGWVQELGVPVLEIHHERKSNGALTPERHNMFGSVYTFNTARTVTQISTTEEQRYDTGGIKKVAARNQKLSDGKVPEPIALTFEFHNAENGGTESVEVRQGALADEVDLMEKMTVLQRIVKAVEHGALKAEAIAEESGDPVKAVREACSRAVTAGKLRAISIPGSKTNEKLYGLPQTTEWIGR
jgi:hypothetical protein